MLLKLLLGPTKNSTTEGILLNVIPEAFSRVNVNVEKHDLGGERKTKVLV